MHQFNEFQRQVKVNVYTKYDETENRVLFHYNPIPTYSDDWNELTKVSRGIVIDLDDYSIVVHPYNKFHNLGEKEHLLRENLPNEEYEVASKLDGSEGILYPLKDGTGLKIITKGGFNTEQGQFGTKILHNKYGEQANVILKSKLYKNLTFVFEILYAHDDKNRIVVAYDEPDLRLIGIRDLVSGEELPYSSVITMAKNLGFKSTELHDITLDQIDELKEKMENFEGWVVRFNSGLYVKVKCSAYLDAHGAKFGSSPKYVFNLLQEGKYDDFIAAIPQDMQSVPNKFKDSLVGWATEFSGKVLGAYDSIPKYEAQKDFAIHVQQNIEKDIQGFMFQIRAGKEFDPFKLRWSMIKDRYKEWSLINETAN
ncbi:RNA ligase [compost metagenome]